MNEKQTTTGAISLDDLHTVDGLVQLRPQFLSVPTLRWQLRSRDKNGLSACVVIVGKKLLISKSRYEQWLGNQAGRAA
jgi:hypothetical protein